MGRCFLRPLRQYRLIAVHRHVTFEETRFKPRNTRNYTEPSVSGLKTRLKRSRRPNMLYQSAQGPPVVVHTTEIGVLPDEWCKK